MAEIALAESVARTSTFDRVLAVAAPHATRHVREHVRGVHGPAHWRRIRANGLRLAAKTPGADPVVVECFAALHDIPRLTDGGDRGHGARAAALAATLHAEDKLGLTDAQAALLMTACRVHNGSGPVVNPTVGVCLDADRLDLERVGVLPDPALLSTTAAKRAARRRVRS